MLNISLYSPAGGYLGYLKFAHSSTQTTYKSGYLFEGRYLGASMGEIANIRCLQKYQLYRIKDSICYLEVIFGVFVAPKLMLTNIDHQDF